MTVRIFFHVRTLDELIEDSSGHEVDTLAQAHVEATKAALDLIADDPAPGPTDGRSFEMRDEEGILVGVVPFEPAVLKS